MSENRLDSIEKKLEQLQELISTVVKDEKVELVRLLEDVGCNVNYHKIKHEKKFDVYECLVESGHKEFADQFRTILKEMRKLNRMIEQH